MGDKITRGDGKPDGKIIEVGTGAGTEKRPGDTSTSATSTAGAGGTGGTGTGGTGTGGTGTGAEEKELSRLAILTDEEKEKYKTADEAEKKRLIRNAKRRERYAKEKAAGGQTVKPRKVKGGKQTEPEIDTTQLNLIIAGISAAIASRPNCEQWLLTDGEISSITTPMAAMLKECGAMQTIGQYSNQIALVMACVTVFAPRVMITVQKQKEVKKRARTGQQTDTTVKSSGDTGKAKKGDTLTSGGHGAEHASNGKNDVKPIPFYGMPIC